MAGKWEPIPGPTGSSCQVTRGFRVTRQPRHVGWQGLDKGRVLPGINRRRGSGGSPGWSPGPAALQRWEEVQGLGVVRGVAPLGHVLRDARFACGETGSVIMSLGRAMGAI